MAMSDEVRAAPRYKTPKKKKKTLKEAFIPQKGDTKGELVSKFIAIIAALALVVCLVVLAVHFYHIFEDKHNRAAISGRYNVYNKASAEVVDEINPDVTKINSDGEVVRVPLVTMPFAEEMLEVNPDYVGYVSIPGVVNEAVVQAEDNNYYLKKNIYGQTRSCGTVYADFRDKVNDYSDMQSDNIILYGHNQRDGGMFGQLDYYKWDYKYWLKNPFIYFDNQYEHFTYVIVASFIINIHPEEDNGYVFDYHNYINFDDSHPFSKFSDEIYKRSHFHTGIDVNENDKFITLSTCSYEWDEARHVIIGRRLRAWETVDNIDTTNFEVNPNPKWPAIYYKYNGGAYVEPAE